MPRQYPRLPMIGVGAVVLRDDHVLLIRRAKPPRQGEWSLPGGLQKLGETIYEAAMREVLEETGVVVSPNGIVEVVDLIERDKDAAVRWHYTLIDVLAAWQAGEPEPAADATEARWFPVADIRRIVAWDETARIVEKAYSACSQTKEAGNDGVS